MNIEENKSRPIGSDKAPVSGQKVMPKGEHNNRAGMRHFPKELPSLKTFSLQGLFTPVGSTLMYIWADIEGDGSHFCSGTPLAQPYWGTFKPPLWINWCSGSIS